MNLLFNFSDLNSKDKASTLRSKEFKKMVHRLPLVKYQALKRN